MWGMGIGSGLSVTALRHDRNGRFRRQAPWGLAAQKRRRGG